MQKDNGSSSPDTPLVLTLKGFCMGTADVIPGVSGGTMAFILGIYRNLIEAIKSFDRVWLVSLFKLNYAEATGRPHFGFLIPLFTGILFALLFFTRVVPLPELLHSHPEQVYGLFFGLICGSCMILIKEIPGLTRKDIYVIFSGIIPGLIIFNLGTISMPDTAPYIFLSGCLAISAMLLPGISGSFILLILNKYAYIFSAIGYFRFTVILPFVVGMLTGLVIFSRVLSWLLHRFLRNTTLVITGLLFASLWVIWPFQDRVYENVNDGQKLVASSPILPGDLDMGFIITVSLVVIGFLVVMIIDRLGRAKSLHSMEG